MAMGLKPGEFEKCKKQEPRAIPLLRGVEGCVIKADGRHVSVQAVAFCLKRGDTPRAPLKRGAHRPGPEKLSEISNTLYF